MRVLKYLYYSIFISSVVLYLLLEYFIADFSFMVRYECNSTRLMILIIILVVSFMIGFCVYYFMLKRLIKSNRSLSKKVKAYKMIYSVLLFAFELNVLLCVTTYYFIDWSIVYLIIAVFVLILLVFFQPKTENTFLIPF